MLPSFFIPAIFIVILAGIIFLGFYFNKKRVVKRKLKKAIGRKVSEFMNGDVAKVVGTVEFVGEPLIAPLSGRKCAYYYVLVEELRSDGKSSHWSKIIEEERGGVFVIRDGRYRAFISKESSIKSYIVQDALFASGYNNDATDVLENYLNAHGRKSESWLHINKRIRYKEGILEEGETMAVVGRGEWVNASQLQLPDTFGKVLVLNSSPDEPIYLSDDPETVAVSYEIGSY